MSSFVGTSAMTWCDGLLWQAPTGCVSYVGQTRSHGPNGKLGMGGEVGSRDGEVNPSRKVTFRQGELNYMKTNVD